MCSLSLDWIMNYDLIILVKEISHSNKTKYNCMLNHMSSTQFQLHFIIMLLIYLLFVIYTMLYLLFITITRAELQKFCHVPWRSLFGWQVNTSMPLLPRKTFDKPFYGLTHSPFVCEMVI